MTDRPEDRRIRDAFARLREETERFAPAPERTLARATSRRRTAMAPRLALAGLAGVLAIVAGWAAWRVAGTATERRTAHLAAPTLRASTFGDGLWRAPTDFLLDVPGGALLRTAPALSVPLPGFPATSPSPSRRSTAGDSDRRITT